MSEKILCAAIWYKNPPLKKPEILDVQGFRPYNVDVGIVISGWRHPNCIAQIVALTGLRSVESEIGEYIQGFLTNKNRFVDRGEAAIIAYNEKQILKPTSELYSEDLY